MIKSVIQKIYYRFSPTRRGILQIEHMINFLQNKNSTIYNSLANANTNLQEKITYLHEDLRQATAKIALLEDALTHTFQTVNDSNNSINEIKISSSILTNRLSNLIADPHKFSDHYEYWRLKRINAIINYFGEEWFYGKKILELGCGFGDIGKVFKMSFNCDVIFSEGRKENCDILRSRFPDNRIYQMNCENEWPFAETESFDMIFHMGLLYHLDNFEFSLIKCLNSTNYLVLETEVSDSDDPEFALKITEQTESYDQSMEGCGSRPSAAYIEQLLELHGWKFERVSDNRCNALFHTYDWEIKNTCTWQPGMRRFWFCCKE